MNYSRYFDCRSIVLVSLLYSGSLVLNSCGRAPTEERASMGAPMASMAGEVSDAVSADRKATNNEVKSALKSAVPIAQKPQLIRTADLSLRLDSIDKMMVQLRQMVQSRQGDIYDFQDERPQGSGQRRKASLALKVPSIVLEEVLAEIVKLGRVESQGIKSQDVTQQIVDTDARLKNLRQQEDLTRKIMDRAGSIKDILAVSQQLSVIREQIEQLDAGVKNLRQQVAYSTINLKVEEIQSVNPRSDAFGVQVEETWKNSTHAAGGLMTNLALAFLWLLPFTPLMAIGAGGVYYIMRRRRQLPVVETHHREEG